MKDSIILDPPVHLYVKTHNVTGLKYFGRTIKDPLKYKGSGLHWLRHLKKHGDDVSTEVIGVYSDSERLHSVALAFSIDNSIVTSTLWANLIVETGYAGIDGWVPDESYRKKISKQSKERWTDESFRSRIIESQSTAWTNERKASHSEKLKQKWTDPEYREFQRINRKPLTAEQREKIAIASRRPRSDATKIRMSEAMKGLPKSEVHKLAISKRRKGTPNKVPHGAEWDSEKSWFALENGLHVRRTTDRANSWFCVESGEKFISLKEAVSKLSQEA